MMQVIRRGGRWESRDAEYHRALRGICEARDSVEGAVLLAETARNRGKNIRRSLSRAEKMLEAATSAEDRKHLQKIIRRYSSYLEDIDAVAEKSVSGGTKIMRVLPGIAKGLCVAASIAAIGAGVMMSPVLPKLRDSLSAAMSFSSGSDRKVEFVIQTSTPKGGGVVGDGRIRIGGADGGSVRIAAGGMSDLFRSVSDALAKKYPSLGSGWPAVSLSRILGEYVSDCASRGVPEEDAVFSVSDQAVRERLVIENLSRVSLRQDLFGGMSVIAGSGYFSDTEVKKIGNFVRKAVQASIVATLQNSNRNLSPETCAQYSRIIISKAEQFGLDPFLVTGVIVTESHGDTNAVSRITAYKRDEKGKIMRDEKGKRVPVVKDGRVVTVPCAVGLMQVNFAAHRNGILAEMGVAEMNQLKDPATGVEAGCRVLSMILHRNDWDEDRALSAYLGVPGSLHLSGDYREKVSRYKAMAADAFSGAVVRGVADISGGARAQAPDRGRDPGM